MIAAEHQGKVPLGDDPLDLGADLAGGSGDLREVTGADVADLELLHVLDREVALVHHLVTQLGEALGEAGDADGGRSHVHTPPAGAEVHGDAEDVDRQRRSGSFVGRGVGGGAHGSSGRWKVRECRRGEALSRPRLPADLRQVDPAADVEPDPLALEQQALGELALPARGAGSGHRAH